MSWLMDEINVDEMETVTVDDCSMVRKVVMEGREKLALIQMNVRSIKKNFDEFLVLLSSFGFEFDVLVLTETWRVEDVEQFGIPDYCVYYNNSTINQNDGVIMYIRSNLVHKVKFKVINELSVLNCSLVKKGRSFNIVPMYRPHSYRVERFLDDLENFLSEGNLGGVTYLLGDINVDILDQSDSISEEYLQILNGAGFKSIINSVTRQTANTATCIDHMFVKGLSTTDLVVPLTLRTNVTDHYVTIALHQVSATRTTGTVGQTFVYRKCVNRELLLSELSKVCWEEFRRTEDVEEKSKIFMANILNCVESATITSRKSTPKKRQPWITTGLINSIRRRDLLFQRFLKEKSDESKTLYTAFRNKLNSLLKKAKFSYYSHRVRSAEGDIKKTWRFINEVTNSNSVTRAIPDRIVVDGVETDDRKQIADGMNKYFDSVGHKLASSILGPSSESGFKHMSWPGSIYVEPTSIEELTGLIYSLKKVESSGCDLITGSLAKDMAPLIAQPFVELVNACFQVGSVPSCFKTALITPVHKGGDRSDPGNYRPLSVITVFAKIFEKVIFIRLTKYLDKFKIISESK
ncbi:uncharacterized protein LOC123320977 [Coccinella septempunctata]|uniref:uncharacterized protein LOC123320977 n=1 Tax=Coccinella septempunctata TaxID=41139 RepID=UPI001D07B527|nr:uncharacterized protein LOC123320977 [Coccinella septempunctata]